MASLWVRWSLILGGIFNVVMGLIFLSNRFLLSFFHHALRAETVLFSRTAILVFPENPIHLLLIHGFGAAVLILGVTLIYSSIDPGRYLAFIFFDAMGRLLFGSMMLVYVLRFQLPRLIALFGVVELTFGLLYLGISYVLTLIAKCRTA